MNSIKPINEWRRVMLDTSVLIDFFKDPARFSKQPEEQRRIERTQQLIGYLGQSEEEKPRPMTFIISAITVAELIKLPEKRDVLEKIISTFNSADVVLTAFTPTDGRMLIQHLEEYLPDGQKFQLLAQLEKDLKLTGISWARQWVSADLKIVVSAKAQKNLDVILTADSRTFFKIATVMELPCVDTNLLPENLFGDIDTTARFS